jgi:type II restriction endonuclease TdeIII
VIQDKQIKSICKSLLEESFCKYFSKPKKETKHIILDRFFPEERRVSSAITGLQTSLGTYWEKLSVALGVNNGFSILDNSILMKPTNLPDNLSSLITRVKREREENGGELDSLKSELNILFEQGNIPQVDFEKMTKGKGSDLILEKNGQIYLIDIKTVQVNANSGNSFNETLILWASYYKYQYGIDANSINTMLVFPYNSGNELDDSAWWNDFGGRVSPLTRQDALVGNEYWSFLTGNNSALHCIIHALDELAHDENFIGLYSQVFECENHTDLGRFSLRVKQNAVEKRFNVELISPISTRGVLTWRHHQNCTFLGRLNALFKSETLDCPSCEEELG